MKLLISLIISLAALLFACSACASEALSPSGEQEDGSSIPEGDIGGGQTEIGEYSYMYIYINGNKLTAELGDNSSAEALVKLLKEGDITYAADDYGNFEKVGSLGHTLPRNDERITARPGDVILYLGSNICLYYGVNTYNFTRLGSIVGHSEGEMRTLLSAGSGEISITLSLN